MPAKVLMIQGTSSHCGKSLVTAAFCRIFKRLGVKVAPFKAQNMSLNSFVTPDGLEIARAQALQALAAGIEPLKEMNPILLKPKGNMTSQMVLNGRPYRDVSSADYFHGFAEKEGLNSVIQALEKLRSQFELVIIEGAGSPAEINLYEMDIANMRVADIVDAPVFLITDIDRGGSFASLVGTLHLLKPQHQARVRGFIFNKFRGDLGLLRPGLSELEKITGRPVLGVIPYVENLSLPDEDSVSLQNRLSTKEGEIRIAVIKIPRISNFTDFAPLEKESCVSFDFVDRSENVEEADIIIIPGTKNTVQDLEWIVKKGFGRAISKAAEDGKLVIGICGGFQVLGKEIHDEKGLEGVKPGVHKGLGLLDIKTYFDDYSKVTKRVQAEVINDSPLITQSVGQKVIGYQIHMGRTILGPKAKPLLKITNGELDGAVSTDGLVFGTYLHGLFDTPPLRVSILNYLLSRKNGSFQTSHFNIAQVWEESLSQLADTVKKYVDFASITRILKEQPPSV